MRARLQPLITATVVCLITQAILPSRLCAETGIVASGYADSIGSSLINRNNQAMSSYRVGGVEHVLVGARTGSPFDVALPSGLRVIGSSFSNWGFTVQADHNGFTHLTSMPRRSVVW